MRVMALKAHPGGHRGMPVLPPELLAPVAEEAEGGDGVLKELPVFRAMDLVA
jgi:hypothetical protein